MQNLDQALAVHKKESLTMQSRSSFFGRSQCIVGDGTTHGGVVLTGSPTNTWHKFPVVRKGDAVYCPKCPPHYFKVAEGLTNCLDTEAGLPLAMDGHLTTCGANLIARQASASEKAVSFLAQGVPPSEHGISFDRFF